MFGLAGWEKHVIRLVGFDAPMPAESVEAAWPRRITRRR